MARPVRGPDLVAVAATAAFDAGIGRLIGEAFEHVGRDGVITTDRTALRQDISVEYFTGTRFDRGYVSPLLITDKDRLEAVLENPFILLFESKIASFREVLPLLESCAKSGTSLLLVAEDFEDEVVSTLVANKLRGTLQTVAVQTPGHGDRRRAILHDLAVVTGGRALTRDLGRGLQSVRPDDLGRAKRVVVAKDSTTILEGAGEAKAVEARLKEIRQQIDLAAADHERAMLQERLANLVGGLAVIKIGGGNDIEVEERDYLVSSAMHSAAAAVQSGWITGGAVQLYRSRLAVLDSLRDSETDRKVGEILAAALSSPLRQLVQSARLDVESTLQAIDASPPDMGVDVLGRRVANMADLRILDAASVLIHAIEQATLFATQALRTAAWHVVDEAPE